MFESFITVSFVGLITGFIFSIPVAGPIGILVTSNALKGRLRYCYRAAVGASLVDFLYVFLAVYGFTQLYEKFEPYIPYLLAAGAIFLCFLGLRIMRTRLNLENIRDRRVLTEKLQNKGGFRTGFALNLLNPGLFLGWLTSSFIMMSLVASLGFNVGGLNMTLDENVRNMNEMDAVKKVERYHLNEGNGESPDALETGGKWFAIVLSALYAAFLSTGSVVWFYWFARFLARNRERIRISLLNGIIRALGIVLCGFSLYLAYMAASQLLAG